jgi:hypothetical protein
MRNIKFLLILLLLGMKYGPVSAQQKSCSWQFHSLNSVGLLEAQAGSAFQLQTINGVQYKSWFVGAGIGLDYYRYRTIPLFIDMRKEFGKTANKLFVYTDLGRNFSWVTDKEKSLYATDDQFSHGLYVDIGLGYKIAVGRSQAFLISLGYSYKSLSETYTLLYYNPDWLSFMDNPEHIGSGTNRVTYNLNRLNIKMGWQF